MAPPIAATAPLITSYPPPTIDPNAITRAPRRDFGMVHEPMLRTERLRLRRWESRDVRPFVKMCADPFIMQFFNGPLTPIGCFTEMERQEVCFDAFHYGTWVVELKETGEFIGCVGLDPTMLDPQGATMRLTWKLRRECWGMGYAFEAALEVMEYALHDLEAKEVIAIIHPGNLRSLRLAERLGLQLRPEEADCYYKSAAR